MAYVRCNKSGGSTPSLNWDISTPLMKQYAKNFDDQFAYTATTKRRVLALCSEVIDEAGSGHSTQANITTTGTVIKSVVSRTSFDSSAKIRDSETRLSLIDLEANDDVIMYCSSRDTYVNKTFIVWDATGVEDIANATYYDAIVDSNRDATKTYITQANDYLMLAQEVAGSNSNVAASISGLGVKSIFTDYSSTYSNAIAVAVTSGVSSETFTTNSVNNHVSTIYGVWQISGSGTIKHEVECVEKVGTLKGNGWYIASRGTLEQDTGDPDCVLDVYYIEANHKYTYIFEGTIGNRSTLAFFGNNNIYSNPVSGMSGTKKDGNSIISTTSGYLGIYCSNNQGGGIETCLIDVTGI